MTTLIALSHGTSSKIGADSIHSLVEAVRNQLSDTKVIEGFIDVQEPDTDDALKTVSPDETDVRIVPLLLSSGFHVRQDVADAAVAAGERVAVSPALGPDDRIVALLLRRLREENIVSTDHIILAVAGSSDPRAVAECREVLATLTSEILNIFPDQAPTIELAFLSAAEPRVDAAVHRAREAQSGQRIIVATYLLAEGFFASQARKAGADVTTNPLLAPHEEPPQELIDIIVDKFTKAATKDGQTGCPASLRGEQWAGCAAGCTSPCR